jgi:hypothetical protein
MYDYRLCIVISITDYFLTVLFINFHDQFYGRCKLILKVFNIAYVTCTGHFTIIRLVKVWEAVFGWTCNEDWRDK